MKKNIIITAIIFLTITIIAVVCYFLKKENETSNDIPIEKISINSQNNIFTYGETYLLPIKISPTNTTNNELIWSSSNPTLVTVNNQGKITITGNEDSWAIITVTTKDETSKASVKINTKKIEKIINVTGITLDNKEITLKYGETIQINANVIPQNATNQNIIWTSDNPTLISIDESGNVKMLKNKTENVTIIAQTEEGEYKSKIKLYAQKVNKMIKVSGIKVDNDELNVQYGDKIKINAKIIPENATNQNIIWYSSDPDIIKVDNQGNIEVIDNKDSEVIITAQTEEGDYKATAKIFVKKYEDIINATSLKFDKTNIKIEKGKEFQLYPVINPSESTSKKITWKSTNSNVAFVNNMGLITAKNIGTAKIIANIDKVNASIIVNVVDTTSPISSPTLEIKTKTDKYTILGSNQTNISEKYYSNDQNIIIRIKQSEDIEYYAYALATTQEQAEKTEKTIVNINEQLELNLNKSGTQTYYIWGLDGSKNFSKRFTRLYIKHQKIFLESSDYKCLPIELNGENVEARLGATCYSSLKRTGTTYENYTVEQKELITRYFNSKISKNAKDKRKATLAAAQFLAGEFDTKIDYVTNLTSYGNGFYIDKGIKFNDENKCWNCTNKKIKYGLQCSGYVSWALYNGGYTKIANYGVYPGANILVAYKSPFDYHAENGDKVLYGKTQTVLDDKLIVSNKNIIEVSANIPWDKIKAGDIVGYKGHVGIIIHLDTKYVYIAHNANWGNYGPYNVNGIQITRYQKNKYHNYEKFGKGRIILMDEVYEQ